MDVVGIMEGAYFKPRTELLQWVNSTLHLSYKKVQEMRTGVAYCRLFAIMYPDALPLARVIVNAKRHDECLKNWKLLQAAFNKVHITYSIDINRQIEAKAIASLEFMQWFYAVWSRLNIAVEDEEHTFEEDVLVPVAALQPRRTARTSGSSSEAPKAAKENVKPRSPPVNRTDRKNVVAVPVEPPSAIAELERQLEQAHLQNRKLESAIAEYDTLVMDLEKERDYYYNLGLTVEQHCKEKLESLQVDGNPVCQCYKDVLRVMFGDDDGSPQEVSDYKVSPDKEPAKESRAELEPVTAAYSPNVKVVTPHAPTIVREERVQPPELEQTADICLESLDLPVDQKKLDEMEDYFA